MAGVWKPKPDCEWPELGHPVQAVSPDVIGTSYADALSKAVAEGGVCMRRYLAVVVTLLLTPPSVAQPATTPPVPLTPVVQWFSGDSYPAASMRAGEEGDVSALLSVDDQGMVTDCHITRSSGHPLLDQATCRLAARRARFAPAKDAQGAVRPTWQRG